MRNLLAPSNQAHRHCPHPDQLCGKETGSNVRGGWSQSWQLREEEGHPFLVSLFFLKPVLRLP